MVPTQFTHGHGSGSAAASLQASWPDPASSRQLPSSLARSVLLPGPRASATKPSAMQAMAVDLEAASFKAGRMAEVAAAQPTVNEVATAQQIVAEASQDTAVDLDRLHAPLAPSKVAGRPRRLVFVRHGQSEADLDPTLLQRVPDHIVHLTGKGREQALSAGQQLQSIFGEESLSAIISPYVRAKETFNGIAHAWKGQTLKVREDVRLREQEFGNYEHANVQELHVQKYEFGAFFFRFPKGESAADAYDRASLFLVSLDRTWEDNTYENCLIVSHGLMIRVLLMRMFGSPIGDFRNFRSLRHGEMVVLERADDARDFKIAYTWEPGGEKEYGGWLNGNGDQMHDAVWSGDPKAPLLKSTITWSRAQSKEMDRARDADENQISF